jgi:hypothetical protein
MSLSAFVTMEKASLWFSVFLVAGVIYLMTYVMSQKALSRIPMIGLELGNQKQREKIFLGRAKLLLQQGYNKVRGETVELEVSSLTHCA